MRSHLLDHDSLLVHLKLLIAGRFQCSAIETDKLTRDEPLIGGRLGFDDLDVLELSTYVEEEFGITMVDGSAESRTALASIANLADFIHRHAPRHAVADPIDRPWTSPEWSACPAAVSRGDVRLAGGVVEL